EEAPVGGEDLAAAVDAIAHVDPATGIDGDGLRILELARAAPGPAPGARDAEGPGPPILGPLDPQPHDPVPSDIGHEQIVAGEGQAAGDPGPRLTGGRG